MPLVCSALGCSLTLLSHCQWDNFWIHSEFKNSPMDTLWRAIAPAAHHWFAVHWVAALLCCPIVDGALPALPCQHQSMALPSFFDLKTNVWIQYEFKNYLMDTLWRVMAPTVHHCFAVHWAAALLCCPIVDGALPCPALPAPKHGSAKLLWSEDNCLNSLWIQKFSHGHTVTRTGAGSTPMVCSALGCSLTLLSHCRWGPAKAAVPSFFDLNTTVWVCIGVWIPPFCSAGQA